MNNYSFTKDAKGAVAGLAVFVMIMYGCALAPLLKGLNSKSKKKVRNDIDLKTLKELNNRVNRELEYFNSIEILHEPDGTPFVHFKKGEKDWRFPEFEDC